VLEGAKTIEDKRFSGGCPWAQALVKEQTVSTQAFGVPLNRAVGDLHLAGDLAETGARDEAFEERFEEVAVVQPVADVKGL
jgi:hypothetical protein